MPTYETLFITLPTLSEDEERIVVAPLAQVVTERGMMVANERVGRRRLAYPIKKFEDGVYTRFLYDADEAIPKELERRLRISDKVLRHLTVRLEEDWAVAAKEQAVRDAEARVEAEAARAAAEAAGELAAAGQLPPVEDAGGEADDTDEALEVVEPGDDEPV
ncbi:MAG: 30S ribosomal protein S6 [Acidobacteriia bacterium]|nr:30S ribosomal protein S6 [Terriglobia bacterium]